MLLFMKTVHENTESGILKKYTLPEGCRWTDLNTKSGITLIDAYYCASLTRGHQNYPRLGIGLGLHFQITFNVLVLLPMVYPAPLCMFDSLTSGPHSINRGTLKPVARRPH